MSFNKQENFFNTELDNKHLIKGETFIIDNKEKIIKESLSDEKISEKYRKGDVRIVTEQARYPLNSVTELMNSGAYDRNPEYQRRKRWNNIRKSRLIESFIMNVPIPPVFLYEIDYSKYEVMDGQQRLTAIDDYYKGKYSLEGLQYWEELNGKKYKELPYTVQKGIDRRYLSSIILLQETAKNEEEADFLKQVVFERLNSGGEKLTAQETRNALYNGKFNQLCIKLAKNDSFRKMWIIPLENSGEEELLKNDLYAKMQDVELVLRFFAYRHIDNLKKTNEKFLDNFLKQANKYPDNTLNLLEKLFNDTVDLVYFLFDKDAFLLPKFDKKYKSPTKTIYDPIMQVFAMYANNKNLRKNKKEINENLYKKKDITIKEKNRKSLFDGRYNNKNDVKQRIEYFKKFLKKYFLKI